MNRKAHCLRLVLTLLCAAVLAACVQAPRVPTQPSVQVPAGLLQVECGGERFTVGVAANDATRGRGLSGRRTLGRNEGMLFLYPNQGVRSFWMKDCHVDLDVLFLDARGCVINVVTLLAPVAGTQELDLPLAVSERPAATVLELPAGTARRLGLRAGSQVCWSVYEGRIE